MTCFCSGLEQAILNTTVLQNGYAFVIDTQGNLIFHRLVTNHSVPVTLQQAEFAGNPTDFNNFAPILSQMEAGNSGNASYYKGGNVNRIIRFDLTFVFFSFGTFLMSLLQMFCRLQKSLLN